MLPHQVQGKRFHVLLTTYEMLMGKTDRPRLARQPWSWLVVDEGHRLKNAGCKLVSELSFYRSSSRLLLTGEFVAGEGILAVPVCWMPASCAGKG